MMKQHVRPKKDQQWRGSCATPAQGAPTSAGLLGATGWGRLGCCGLACQPGAGVLERPNCDVPSRRGLSAMPDGMTSISSGAAPSLRSSGPADPARLGARPAAAAAAASGPAPALAEGAFAMGPSGPWRGSDPGRPGSHAAPTTRGRGTGALAGVRVDTLSSAAGKGRQEEGPTSKRQPFTATTPASTAASCAAAAPAGSCQLRWQSKSATAPSSPTTATAATGPIGVPPTRPAAEGV